MSVSMGLTACVVNEMSPS